MEQLTLDPSTDLDIEEELRDDQHSHAIPFCYLHKGPQWFPIAGSIVQTLCNRLIRVREFLGYEPDKLGKKPCEECKYHKGKTNCYVCNREIYG